MNSPSSPTWWQRIWANRGPIAAGAAAVLVLACPLLPAQAQVPCRAAQQGLQLVIKLAGDGSSSSSSPAPSSSSSSGCVDDQVRSVPNFCRCRGGVWTDYFNPDAGCGS